MTRRWPSLCSRLPLGVMSWSPMRRSPTLPAAGVAGSTAAPRTLGSRPAMSWPGLDVSPRLWNSAPRHTGFTKRRDEGRERLAHAHGRCRTPPPRRPRRGGCGSAGHQQPDPRGSSRRGGLSAVVDVGTARSADRRVRHSRRTRVAGRCRRLVDSANRGGGDVAARAVCRERLGRRRLPSGVVGDRPDSVPVDGMPCAHLRAALARAIGIGHDTDTVAAIAGALLGARWGASAVPAEWRRVLHGYPGLTGERLVELATLAAGRGPDRQGWPGVDRLDHGVHLGGEPVLVQHPLDDGVWLGDILP